MRRNNKKLPMTWTIDYYNQSVYEEVKALPKLINAKFEAIMDKMTEHGRDLGMPLPNFLEKVFLK